MLRNLSPIGYRTAGMLLESGSRVLNYGKIRSWLVRRADFQRQTLLELQDAAGQLIRRTGEAAFANLKAQRDGGGAWGSHPHSADLAESLRSARMLVAKLSVRVRDVRVVRLTDHLAKLSADCTLAADQETAFSKFDEASATAQELNSRTGEVLRELDQLEDSELYRFKS